MLFNARLFKACWANARRAMSTDPHRAIQGIAHMLCQVYPTGLRVVTTDSYALVQTFIPHVDATLDDWPADDATPDLELVVHDGGNIVVSTCAHADKFDAITVLATATDLTFQPAHLPGHPTVVLSHIDVAFPSWATFFKPYPNPTPTEDEIAFNADYLAKVAGIVGGGATNPLRLRIADHLKPVLFTRTGAHHRAVLMPVRINGSN